MPRIITGNPSQLGRAAGQAAYQYAMERERQDRLNSEAQQLKLAERQLEQRDRSFERGVLESDRAFDFNAGQAAQQNQRANTQLDLSVKNAERQGAIFERAVGQEDADIDFLKQYGAREFGIDQAELDGMSPDGVRSAMNLLEHRRAVENASANIGRLKGVLYERLGVDPAAMEGAAPGVQTEEGVNAAMGGNPIVDQVEAMIGGAQTLDDYSKASEVIMGLLNESFKAEIRQKQVMQTIELRAPEIEILKGSLPNQVGAAMDTAVMLYQAGLMDDEQFDQTIMDARKLQREVYKQMTSSMFSSISRDFMLDAPEKVQMIQEVGGQPEKPVSTESAGPANNGFAGSRQGRKFIEKYGSAIKEKAAEIRDPQKRLEFVGQQVKASLRESGLELSPDDAIDLADRIMGELDK